MGDEIELPLAMSWPLYQYSLRPGHCLTIFPYLLRYSAYIFIISFFVGVYHAQDKTIISIIFCIVNVNKKGGFTELLTRKADYLLIFSSSASTNSGKAMIARIVTVSPPLHCTRRNGGDNGYSGQHGPETGVSHWLRPPQCRGRPWCRAHTARCKGLRRPRPPDRCGYHHTRKTPDLVGGPPAPGYIGR